MENLPLFVFKTLLPSNWIVGMTCIKQLWPVKDYWLSHFTYYVNLHEYMHVHGLCAFVHIENKSTVIKYREKHICRQNLHFISNTIGTITGWN